MRSATHTFGVYRYRFMLKIIQLAYFKVRNNLLPFYSVWGLLLTWNKSIEIDSVVGVDWQKIGIV